jgi:hypothetical protein
MLSIGAWPAALALVSAGLLLSCRDAADGRGSRAEALAGGVPTPIELWSPPNAPRAATPLDDEPARDPNFQILGVSECPWPPDPGPTVLGQVPRPNALAASGCELYFTSVAGGLSKMSKVTGSVTRIAASPPLPPLPPGLAPETSTSAESLALVIDGDTAYWTDWGWLDLANGLILKRAFRTSLVSFETVEITEDGTGSDPWTELAVDGRFAYLQSYEKLERVAVAGGSAAVMASNVFGDQGLTVARSTLFYALDAALVTDPLGGGPTSTVAIAGSCAVGAAMIHDDANLYWSARGGGCIFAAPIDGGPSRLLSAGLSYATAWPEQPTGLAVDGTYVYSVGSGAAAGIIRVPIAGGPSEIVWTELGAWPTAIVVDDRFVYWTDSIADQILRLEKPPASEADGGVAASDGGAPDLGPTDAGLPPSCPHFLAVTDIFSSPPNDLSCPGGICFWGLASDVVGAGSALFSISDGSRCVTEKWTLGAAPSAFIGDDCAATYWLDEAGDVVSQGFGGLTLISAPGHPPFSGPAGMDAVGLSAAGSLLLESAGAKELAVYDIASGALVRTTTLAAAPISVAISRSGLVVGAFPDPATGNLVGFSWDNAGARIEFEVPGPPQVVDDVGDIAGCEGSVNGAFCFYRPAGGPALPLGPSFIGVVAVTPAGGVFGVAQDLAAIYFRNGALNVVQDLPLWSLVSFDGRVAITATDDPTEYTLVVPDPACPPP